MSDEHQRNSGRSWICSGGATHSDATDNFSSTLVRLLLALASYNKRRHNLGIEVVFFFRRTFSDSRLIEHETRV